MAILSYLAQTHHGQKMQLGYLWYRAGLPATLYAALRKSAEYNGRTVAFDPPEELEGNTDLLMALQTLYENAVSRRNFPMWFAEYAKAWARLAVKGVPFNWADVAESLIAAEQETSATFAGLFQIDELESRIKASGNYQRTNPFSRYTDDSFQFSGTLRAAMWPELPEKAKQGIADMVSYVSEPQATRAKKAYAELLAIPAPKWQLDFRALPSYLALNLRFTHMWGDEWSTLPQAYTEKILDFVWAEGGYLCLNSDYHSMYDIYACCIHSIEPGSFERFLRDMHSAADTSSLVWLAEMAKLVPDPNQLVAQWPGIRDQFVEAMETVCWGAMAERIMEDGPQ